MKSVLSESAPCRSQGSSMHGRHSRQVAENPDIGGVGVIPLRVVENVNAAAA